MAKELSIRMISDTICPFCFIGKRRLEQALAQLPSDVKTTVVHSPFYLDPSMPEQGVSKMERYKAKFGADRVDTMIEQMKKNGLTVTPPIKFSYGGKIGNTKNSHRLLEFVLDKYGPKKQGEVVEQIMQGYFEHEQDITSKEFLLKAANAAGVNDADEVLNGTGYSREVDEKVEQAHKLNVTGVPFFVINEKYAISGAQDESVFQSVLKKALE